MASIIYFSLSVVDLNQSIKGSKTPSPRFGRLPPILSCSDLIFLHLYEIRMCRFDFVFTTAHPFCTLGMLVCLCFCFQGFVTVILVVLCHLFPVLGSEYGNL